MRQLFTYHPVVGYHFVAGLTARVLHESGGYFVRINQAGFRSDREFLPHKRPGTRRVLLFGDSFTAGDGVPNQQRYGDLLETMVSDLEVFNYGLSASGPDQQYLAYREFAKDIEHDLVILAIHVDNVRRVAAQYMPHLDEGGTTAVWAKPHFELVDGELVLRNVPVPRLGIARSDLGPELSEALRSFKQRGRADPAADPIPEYEDVSDPGWSVLRAILEHWVGESPRPVLLVPIPMYVHIEDVADPGGYQQAFAGLCETAGCHLHDPLPDMRDRPLAARRAFRFARDIHWTASGHAGFAASLRPAVERALEPPAAAPTGC